MSLHGVGMGTAPPVPLFLTACPALPLPPRPRGWPLLPLERPRRGLLLEIMTICAAAPVLPELWTYNPVGNSGQSKIYSLSNLQTGYRWYMHGCLRRALGGHGRVGARAGSSGVDVEPLGRCQLGRGREGCGRVMSARGPEGDVEGGEA